METCYVKKTACSKENRKSIYTIAARNYYKTFTRFLTLLRSQCIQYSVLGIRIRRIRMFLGLPNPDPDSLVGGMDPDPDPDRSFSS
jgi:hypothetical protein